MRIRTFCISDRNCATYRRVSIKFHTLIFTLSAFAIGCSSDGVIPTRDEIPIEDATGTGTIVDFEPCNGDTPVNIDGYFDSPQSPISLVLVPSPNVNFIDFQYASTINDYRDFRIGVGAAYNLGDLKVVSNLSHSANLNPRVSCPPQGRYTVGPVLTSLSITANLNVGINYPAGSELNDAFLIAPIQSAYDANYPPTQAIVPYSIPATTVYFTISNYLRTEPHAPVGLFLRMNVPPSSQEEYNFTITYTLSSGLSGSINVPSVIFK